jgi:hypothetical protein
VLVCSTRDNTYNYYVYYAGRIDFVPLLTQQAVYYGGTTPITVGYSEETSIETSVTQGIEKAIEESVETSESLSVSLGIAVSAGFMGSGLEVSTDIETSITSTLGRSVSTASTYETSQSKVEGKTFSTEFTVGTAGEPIGMYRYVLFASTDVFYNVKVRRSGGTIEEATVALCARPDTYWGVDYDPTLGGSPTWDKTGDEEILQVPEFDPKNLPLTRLSAPDISTSVTGTSSTMLYVHSSNAYFASDGLTYYVTFDGSDPTKESYSERANAAHHMISIGFNYDVVREIPGWETTPFDREVTVKAFASHPQALDSPIAEKKVRLVFDAWPQ